MALVFLAERHAARSTGPENCRARSTLKLLSMHRSSVPAAAVLLAVCNATEQELRQAPFDVLLDSCTFHSMSDDQRQRYAANLARMARPGGGLLYLACMSEQETREGGPRWVGTERWGV